MSPRPPVVRSQAIIADPWDFHAPDGQTNGGDGSTTGATHAARRISLVLLDMTMPYLDGAQAFQAMQRIGSGVPSILSSG